MILISEKLIFIHIPRTGGTSIESALGQKLGNDEKHLAASEIRKKAGDELWENAFVFSFVRNPWDRMISLYHQPYFKNQTDYADKGLEHFIRNYNPAAWEKKFYYEYLDTDGIDFVGRFENRAADLAKISKETGVTFDVDIHERKTSRRQDYRSYYDDHSAQLVYDMYRSDIEEFGYKF